MKILKIMSLFIFVAGFAARADLYVDDEFQRTVMTEEERHLPAVQVGRGSGVLLSDSLVLTASHATKNWQSYSMNGSTFFFGPNNARYYFKIESILEENLDLDYAILKINWQNQIVPPGLQWVKKIIMPNTLELDKVHSLEFFALGAPWDKIPNPMRSKGGKLVILSDKNTRFPLFFNAGVVGGNSGGPILASDCALLGIVNGGPHSLGETGFDGNDPNNPKSWNWGTPITSIYMVSPILKELFP
ncbi:MAG: hypothetical protein A2381_09285 [Bdellovibrionales bacterium RIFOXYB1_FULL_37_110]|nr:MAG: hypothetical protein A2417_14325 [Bdellovibrionales bacterium RIFOXYC1_FULL_37_79]OFZ56872.1 MAG: hypothetical protein A2381_09285 [Bdellovibrionales bacterium RIFOXYB1_FULL_37_110]OFZ65558.1 MAG: hypothetical protein A2577_17240 [Bdellovibrionales bacterium RIFOXYD1_FULL_36_51]